MAFHGYPGMALTDVGAYGANSASFYGTNDQGGNVFEWNDAIISDWSRGLRGSAWDDHGSYLASSSRDYDITPGSASYAIGFRVASSEVSSVPEPASMFSTLALVSADCCCVGARST